MSEQHDLLIKPGDEELWIQCTCGWKVQPSPWPQTKPLEAAWEAWYWPHAIKEHIKLEEAGLR